MKKAILTVDYQIEKIIIDQIKSHTQLDNEFIVFITASKEIAIKSSHVIDLVIEDDAK